MYQAGRWPVSVYPGWLRVGFTVLVPLAFAVTVPASVLAGHSSGWLVLGSVAFTAALAVLTRRIWRLALRRYSGASTSATTRTLSRAGVRRRRPSSDAAPGARSCGRGRRGRR